MTPDSEMHMDTQAEDSKDRDPGSVVVVGQRAAEASEAQGGGPSVTIQGSQAVSGSLVV